MKIAIIGASGMIGNHTARAALAAGHELRLLHRSCSNLQQLADLDFETAIASLNDQSSIAAALKGVDAVINCAGYYPAKPQHWRKDVAAATEQMQNFYQACAKHDLRKIVYLGGSIAIPIQKNGQPAGADSYYSSQPQNHNAYLQCKWAMDEMARTQAAAGLPIVTGIPSMCFGEYDSGPTTGQLITEIANGTMPAYVRGIRNCIYTGDAGRGLVLAAEKGRPGERYLFTNENLSMDAIVQLIAKAANVSAPKPVPLTVAKLLGKAQLLKYKLKGSKSENLPKISATAIAIMSAGQALDGSKASKELGFQPTVSIPDSVRRALSWFHENSYINQNYVHTENKRS